MFDFTFDEQAVLHELGLDDVDATSKAQVIQGLYIQLNNRMRALLLPSLTPEEIQAFNATAQKSEDEARTWLINHFPDYKERCAQVLADMVAHIKQVADVSVEASKRSSSPEDPPQAG